MSPRAEDPDDLVEVGLGIHRRLNEEGARKGRPAFPPEQVSFWYLANRLGRRMLRGWEARRLRGLREESPGVWRCEVIGRPVFLVSGSELPVEEDSLPLHLIGRGRPEVERGVAEFLATRQLLWERYGGWLASLHQEAYKEVVNMAKTSKRGFNPSLDAVIETMGMDWVIEHVGLKRVLDQAGMRRVLDEVGVDKLAAALTPQERLELLRSLSKP